MNAVLPSYESALVRGNVQGASEPGKFMAKLTEKQAKDNQRILLCVRGCEIARELASAGGQRHPTGSSMEALRLVSWLFEVLAGQDPINEPNAAIIRAMTAVTHRENLDKQDRYVMACGYIETAATEYHKAQNDGHRSYAATVLAVQLYGLDRKFSTYCLPSDPKADRSGHKHLVELLAAWIPTSAKSTVGHHHTSGLLATLCIETGAFGAEQLKPRTVQFKAAVEKLARLIQSKTARQAKRDDNAHN